MEQPHRTKSPQRRTFFVPVRGALSVLGAVTGLAVFWVTELKRDPRTPHVCIVETLLCDLFLGQDTRVLYMDSCRILWMSCNVGVCF
jgi:hypothetical protein